MIIIKNLIQVNNLLMIDTYLKDLQYTSKFIIEICQKISGYIMLYHPVSYTNIEELCSKLHIF